MHLVLHLCLCTTVYSSEENAVCACQLRLSPEEAVLYWLTAEYVPVISLEKIRRAIKKKLNLYLYQWVGLGSVCIHKVSRLSWGSFLEMWCTFIALKRMCGPFISVLIFCWVTYWKAVFRRFKLLVLNTWSTSASHELCLTLVAQLKEMKVDTLSNVLSLRRLPSLWSSLPFCLCIII